MTGSTAIISTHHKPRLASSPPSPPPSPPSLSTCCALDPRPIRNDLCFSPIRHPFHLRQQLPEPYYRSRYMTWYLLMQGI